MSAGAIRMLLIEDTDLDAELISMMLDRSPEIEVEIARASHLREAIQACADSPYDIILLDLGLPDSTGVESVTRLKTVSPDTPIVVLTGDDRGDTAIEAIHCGAQDFLPKQHLVGQLLTRMTKHSIARQQQLARAQSEALIDGLTGMANRRAGDAELNRRFADYRRSGDSFCIGVIDIDHFKRINDRWGHDTGDFVIRAVGEIVGETIGESDHASRFGGEEFAITMPKTTLQGAMTVADRCRRAIEERITAAGPRVTVSVGLAEVTQGDDAKSLFARADRALYAAKHGGRNRCIADKRSSTIESMVDCQNDSCRDPDSVASNPLMLESGFVEIQTSTDHGAAR